MLFSKQKTAYEIQIRDWSSDVCSSDLGAFGWVAFLFFAGVVCPPALALAFVRWWRSRGFWLVWVGYLAFVAESAVLATLLAFLLSPLNSLTGGLGL